MATFLLIWCGCVAFIVVCLYLADCARADRWLTPAEWWDRAACPHRDGYSIAVSFDGELTYVCASCGKHVRKGLGS